MLNPGPRQRHHSDPRTPDVGRMRHGLETTPEIGLRWPVSRRFRAAEFFAGMGLMRAGLDRCSIDTVFANDVDATKAAIYRDNWGGGGGGGGNWWSVTSAT